MRLFTLKNQDPDGVEKARKAMVSITKGLQWVRERRPVNKIPPAEYIAESRLVIALDELRKGINRKEEDRLAPLILDAENCYVEFWDEARKRVLKWKRK